MCKKCEKDYWERFEDDKGIIFKKTKSQFTNEYRLLIQAFNLYVKGFDNVPSKLENDADCVRIALLSQNLLTIKCSLNLALSGFYIQSLIPMRNVAENWIVFWYLIKYPGEASRWINPTWKMRPPKFDTMRNKIDHPSKQIKSKLREFYDELNRFTHTDPVIVLSMIEQEGNKNYIKVGVKYNQDSFAVCIYSILLWTGYCIDALSSLIPIDNAWQAENEELKVQIIEYIDKYNQTHKLEIEEDENESI